MIGNAFWFHALLFGTRTVATVSVLLPCVQVQGVSIIIVVDKITVPHSLCVVLHK